MDDFENFTPKCSYIKCEKIQKRFNILSPESCEEILMNNLKKKIGKQLGKGTFGTVYELLTVNDKQTDLVIKIQKYIYNENEFEKNYIPKIWKEETEKAKKMSQDAATMEQVKQEMYNKILELRQNKIHSNIRKKIFENEYKILDKLNNSNLVPKIDSIYWCNEPYYGFITLFEIIEKMDEELNSQNITVKIVEDVINKIGIMHNKYGIVNLDLDMENILIKNNEAYLTDFGIAQEISNKKTTRYLEYNYLLKDYISDKEINNTFEKYLKLLDYLYFLMYIIVHIDLDINNKKDDIMSIINKYIKIKIKEIPENQKYILWAVKIYLQMRGITVSYIDFEINMNEEISRRLTMLEYADALKRIFYKNNPSALPKGFDEQIKKIRKRIEKEPFNKLNEQEKVAKKIYEKLITYQ